MASTVTRTLKIIVDQGGNATDGLGKLGNVLKDIGAKSAKIAIGGITAIGGATVAVGGYATALALDFEKATNAIIRGTGASGESLKAMEQATKNLKASVAGVGTDFETIGATLAEVNTRTGATGKSLEDFTGQILKLTRLTGGDAVKNVQLITRVMGDWGIGIKDADKLLDQLHGAGQAFGIGVDNISSKVVQFGAPLRQMGFSLEESIALFGKWEKEGVNAELAIGSLRIAAGKFAREQQEANKVVVGGVESMAAAEEKLFKLKNQLEIATLKQSEFTEKTKASTRAQNEMRINDLTRQIQELEAAMAQGEFRTVQSTGAQLDLKDSLQQTFEAIKAAKTETEALAIGMETFGARAGPDMTAAIREGRFALDDAIAALQSTSGGLDDAANRTLTLGERFGILKSKVDVSLIPLGDAILTVAEAAMPTLEEAANSLAGFIDSTLAPAIAKVPEKVNSARETFNDWSEETKNDHKIAMDLLAIGWDKITGAADTNKAATEGNKEGLRLAGMTLGELGAKLFSVRGVLEAWTNAVKLAAIVVYGIGRAMENARHIASSLGIIISSGMNRANSALNNVVSGFHRMVDAAKRAASAIPRWLRPGSPTPFEIGLRGIAKAAGDVSGSLPSAFTAPTASPFVGGGLAASGGGGITIQVNYSPAISTADKFEIEAVLAPIIANKVRDVIAGRR